MKKQNTLWYTIIRTIRRRTRIMLLAKAISFPNLHINIDTLPKSFSLFGFDVAFYGVIIALGMILGIAMAVYEAKKTGQDTSVYTDFAIFAIIVSVVFARIYYVVFSWDYYSEHLGEIINIRGGGLAIYGGVIGAVLTAIVYCKIKKYSLGLLMDTGVLGLLVGQIIGRYGNFFNREAFGGAVSNSHPFAMRLYFGKEFAIDQVPEQVASKIEHISGKSLVELGYVQVQPTFLYESLWNLIVLIVILVFRRKKAFNGEVFLWYLFGYGVGRFIIEGMRTDQLLIPGVEWPVSQVLSAVLVVAAVAIDIAIRLKKRPEKIPEESKED